MVASYVTEESYWCIIFCLSPCGEIFCPAMLTLYFYLQKSQKYAEYEYVESKHTSIIESSGKNSKKITISSLFLFYEKLYIYFLLYSGSLTLVFLHSL